MPEDYGDWIKRLVSDYGLSEDEAHIFAHLIEAQRIFHDLPDELPVDRAFQESINTALNTLALRVVRRDHPNGWRTLGEIEEAEEAEPPTS